LYNIVSETESNRIHSGLHNLGRLGDDSADLSNGHWTIHVIDQIELGASSASENGRRHEFRRPLV